MTIALERPSGRPVEPGAAPPVVEEKPLVPRWAVLLGILVVWLVVWSFTKGRDTLVLGGLDKTDLHQRLAELNAKISDNAVTTAIGDALRSLVDWLRGIISVPTPPRPAPVIGWLGVTAIAAWIGYAVANWRIALLVACSFVAFGAFGYWEDSMDLLVVIAVSVALTVLIGFPLAVWMGISRRAERAFTLVLDLLQTMPTFVYLIPALLLFGVGASTAIVCTLAYALPPIVRIASFGIRDASPTTVEATDSLGQTTWQRLVKVQIPMARSTIILGLNQTILAALSMAIIASYVNGPGLGKPVLAALTVNDVGRGAVPGMLIVLMAIMLDRLTTAASERSERVARGGGEDPRRRRIVLGALLVPVAVAVWYSRYALDAALFPESDLGSSTAARIDDWSDATVRALDGPAGQFRDWVSYGLLNPMQQLLANSPWWLAFVALFAIAVTLGGRRVVVPSLLCLAAVRLLDLWNDSMVVLNMTLVATLLVMVLALVFGVWMGRSHRADLVIRPILDAGQTIPAFVYLIPVLALFGSSRMTAIVAAVVYAAPAAIKLVADGIRGLPHGVIEAGRSVGSTTWQEVVKVQLPMARKSLVLATNQGLLYVLAMVVIGGLVGAQALGYDVVYGLAHIEASGKGLAAGLSIVALGVLIDRVMRAAASDDRDQVAPDRGGRWWRPRST